MSRVVAVLSWMLVAVLVVLTVLAAAAGTPDPVAVVSGSILSALAIATLRWWRRSSPVRRQ